MPFHPWLSSKYASAASKRIKFLRLFAHETPNLFGREPTVPETSIPPPEGFDSSSLVPRPDPAVLPAVSALTEAAELAFAADRTNEGVELANEAVGLILNEPPRQWHPMRLGLLGAVTKRCRIETSAEGIGVRVTRDVEVTARWDGASAVLDHVAGSLVAADLAFGDRTRVYAFLALGETLNDSARLAQIAIAKSAEANLLALFPSKVSSTPTHGTWAMEGEEGAWAAAVALHQNYVARLRTLAADTIRWSQLRWRVPILDWPLLAIHLGLLRSGGREKLDKLIERCGSGQTADVAKFLRDLAIEIDGESQGGFYPEPPQPSSGSWTAVAERQYQSQRHR